MKIICKVLANWLKLVLDKIISPNQSAFVPGRMIQDNIIVANEAFHFLKTHVRGKKPSLGVKLDFNKAYDRVQWDFFERGYASNGLPSRLGSSHYASCYYGLLFCHRQWGE